MKEKFPKLTVENTQVRPLPSQMIGQEFKISVRLPSGYESTQEHYPVVYFVDGFLWAGMFAEITRVLELVEEVPKVILVGIDYSKQALNEVFTSRTRDLTPTPVDDADFPPGSGGAEKFLRFIRSELFPVIDSSYRTDPENRTLYGHSLGGTFVLYALFHAIEAFHNYMAISPAIWWDNGVIFQYEEAYARNNAALPVKLFLAVGSLEDDNPQRLLRPDRKMVAPLRQFSEILSSRGYQGLQMETVVIADETHATVGSAAFARGMRWVYARKSILDAMYRTSQESGIEAAIQQYHLIKEIDSAAYNFGERELNLLGYILLRSGKAPEAIEIFKLNMEAYPESANVYDSLGEAYMATGDTALAYENYERALALDPNNPRATEIVKQLKNTDD